MQNIQVRIKVTIMITERGSIFPVVGGGEGVGIYKEIKDTLTKIIISEIILVRGRLGYTLILATSWLQ